MNSYSHSSSSFSQNMNKYWIPNKDIHKKVIVSHIQLYLGPDATVRSYTKDGEDGFLITTPGECLTDEQIDEICMKSMELWESQAAGRLSSSGGSSPSAMLKRPLHKPVVVARAGSRSSGSGSTYNRRSPAHRSSYHSPPHQQQQQQQQRARPYFNNYPSQPQPQQPQQQQASLQYPPQQYLPYEQPLPDIRYDEQSVSQYQDYDYYNQHQRSSSHPQAVRSFGDVLEDPAFPPLE